jgi:predicted acetyltransferase
MDIEVRPCASVEELHNAVNPISHYFGHENATEDAERSARWIEVERMHGAFEGDKAIGGAGAFTYRMSVPGGGSVPAAGVTVVGVLPTHRRRGVLRSLMREQLEDSRERGDLAAFFWSSEGSIYGRFGYGLASRIGSISLPRERTGFAAPFEPRGTVRIVDLDEAVRTFPPLYEQIFEQRPGMNSRSQEWWETRRLFDDPARRQGGPKHRALLELDGEPAGYVIYNVKQDWRGGSTTGAVTITEVVTPTPEAARELWRWLLDLDWTSEFKADFLPLDHELFQLLAEPRRMQADRRRPRAVGAHVQRRRDRARGRGRVPAGERRPLARHARGCRAHRRRARSPSRRHRPRLGLPRRVLVPRARARVTRGGARRRGGGPRRHALPHGRRPLVRRDLLEI